MVYDIKYFVFRCAFLIYFYLHCPNFILRLRECKRERESKLTEPPCGKWNGYWKAHLMCEPFDLHLIPSGIN